MRSAASSRSDAFPRGKGEIKSNSTPGIPLHNSSDAATVEDREAMILGPVAASQKCWMRPPTQTAASKGNRWEMRGKRVYSEPTYLSVGGPFPSAVNSQPLASPTMVEYEAAQSNAKTVAPFVDASSAPGRGGSQSEGPGVSSKPQQLYLFLPEGKLTKRPESELLRRSLLETEIRRGMELQLQRTLADTAPDGDDWYAIVYGTGKGVFPGPFADLEKAPVGFYGTHYRGFRTHSAAFNWFRVHHADAGVECMGLVELGASPPALRHSYGLISTQSSMAGRTKMATPLPTFKRHPALGWPAMRMARRLVLRWFPKRCAGNEHPKWWPITTICDAGHRTMRGCPTSATRSPRRRSLSLQAHCSDDVARVPDAPRPRSRDLEGRGEVGRVSIRAPLDQRICGRTFSTTASNDAPSPTGCLFDARRWGGPCAWPSVQSCTGPRYLEGELQAQEARQMPQEEPKKSTGPDYPRTQHAAICRASPCAAAANWSAARANCHKMRSAHCRSAQVGALRPPWLMRPSPLNPAQAPVADWSQSLVLMRKPLGQAAALTASTTFRPKAAPTYYELSERGLNPAHLPPRNKPCQSQATQGESSAPTAFGSNQRRNWKGAWCCLKSTLLPFGEQQSVKTL
ncbi:hypothetical protein BV25DRAFT_1843179 [Artomyces pyxidatus]|uniref:Uncharacterized protein n=1 Tax=Artomyces pyxidatus TaxID=48021 RepID=A0ACB8SGF6_9AGAM|nr:hypothetical protein BV25DRAFT_1843179 [Artomyces pyxidatus]